MTGTPKTGQLIIAQHGLAAQDILDVARLTDWIK